MNCPLVTRIQLPGTLSAYLNQGPLPLPEVNQSRRMESFVLMGGPGITTESILRSRIAELEAQVENLKAQLREAKK